MSDGFSDLILRSNAFFKELGANNRRDWFEDHKDSYVSEIKKPAELLADVLSEDLSRLTGTALKSKIFRIHRDVRFSKDKTPYNTHLHMSWTDPSMPDGPAYFFGSSPSYLIVGTGLMSLSGPPLARLRSRIDEDGDTLAAALGAAEKQVGATLSSFGPEPLKRVPKPYDADHPHAELLKRKSLAVTAPPAPDWQDAGLVPAVNATARALLPIWTWTREALG